MKKSFSISWNGSTQVRKQRKYRFNAPLHVRSKFSAMNLSKELRKKHGIRSLQARVGDEVVVQRGSFKKKKAKIMEVDLLKNRIVLENITRQKRDGSKIPVYFNPSKLLAISINTDDKKRLKSSNKTNKQEAKVNASNTSVAK